MPETQSQPRFIRFGDFEADLRSGELRKNGAKLKFGGQPFQVLAILLERPGEVVTREELQKRLWPDTFVDAERNLNTTVNKIREVLGDSAENPRFVETLPRRGYRFLPAVETVSPQPDARAREEESVKPKKLKTPLAWAAFLIFLAIALGVAWYLRRPLPPPRVTDYAQITLDGRHKDIAGTDGSRIFLNLDPGYDAGQGLGVFQLSIADGTLARVPVEIPAQTGVPSVRCVSPDGSALLLRGSWTGEGYEIWVVGSMGHPARLLARGQDATFSADGKFVVYATQTGDFYRIPTEGGAPSLIVASPGGEHTDVSEPTVSPDGKAIRFTRASAIWEVASNGSNLHQVLPGWSPALVKCCGRWTADGAFFVFVAGPPPLHYDAGTHLWAIDERRRGLHLPISEPIQLTSGPTRWGRPIASRDRSRMFVRGVNLRGELVRYDDESRQLRPWLGGVSADYVSFSSDGKSLAYVSYPDGVLWRANRDGSSPVELSKPPAYPKAPVWSPDGKQILFTDFAPSGFDSIYVISEEGGEPQRLIPEEIGEQFDANWSPEGKKVIYFAGPKGIHIFDLATRKITALPDSTTRYSPRWSPDGRYICAVYGGKEPDRANDLELFDLETQRWITLIEREPDLSWPTWSRDGRYIYYHRPSGVFRVLASGGKPEPVADLQGFRGTGFFWDWMGLDPDGAPLLLRDVSSEEIYSLKLE